jgi:hypothetical protein
MCLDISINSLIDYAVSSKMAKTEIVGRHPLLGLSGTKQLEQQLSELFAWNE